MKQVTTLSEFKSLINNSVIIVDFGANWCSPCKQIAPKFQELSVKFSKINFVKVDIDSASDIAGFVGITSLPTFKLYSFGNEIGSVVGSNYPKLCELLTKV
jgi:thioredoxin 1